MSRYNFYLDEKNNTVICVSSYEGKKVKGRAKCHPNDKFDYEFGKKLAKLRCDLKVAEKREKRAVYKYEEVLRNCVNVAKNRDRLADYLTSSMKEVKKLKEDLFKLESSFHEN